MAGKTIMQNFVDKVKQLRHNSSMKNRKTLAASCFVGIHAAPVLSRGGLTSVGIGQPPSRKCYAKASGDGK